MLKDRKLYKSEQNWKENDNEQEKEAKYIVWSVYTNIQRELKAALGQKVLVCFQQSQETGIYSHGTIV